MLLSYSLTDYLTPGLLFHLLELIGGAVVIFLFFWLLRKFLARKILNFFTKLSQKTETNLDDHLLASFKKPLELFFVSVGLYLALLYLPLTPNQDITVLKIFRSAVIILMTMGVYNFVGNEEIFGSELQKLLNIKLDKILIPFFSKSCKVITIGLGLCIIAGELGYNVSGFIAGLGLGGLAFALAAQDTLANVFGGFMIITDKPFTIGDWIQTPTVEGIVEDINFRSTKIRTFAQALITIPNKTLANEAITNWSRMGKRRITFRLRVPYNVPKRELENCLEQIRTMLKNHGDIDQQTLFVHLDGFGDSSWEIFFYFFTKTTVWAEYLKVKEDVNFKIMEILEDCGIPVAFPGTAVYMVAPGEESRERIYDF